MSGVTHHLLPVGGEALLLDLDEAVVEPQEFSAVAKHLLQLCNHRRRRHRRIVVLGPARNGLQPREVLLVHLRIKVRNSGLEFKVKPSSF